MKTGFTVGWRALAVAALASAAVPAMAAVSMPAERYQGSVGFVSGGVGEGEASLFRQQSGRHALEIGLFEHAGNTDEFTAHATVKISDRRGNTVLDARADGPFMLVDLPPGRYSVEATLSNDTLRKSAVWIAPGRTARETFEFPAHTDG